MKVDIKQKELDFLNERIKELNTKKKKLTKEITDEGYSIIKGNIKKEEKVYGSFYDMEFYSHFDGHMSEAVYHTQSGASIITEYSYIKLVEMIEYFQKNGALSEEDFDELFEDDDFHIEAGDWFYDTEDLFDFFKIDDDGVITWEYKGSSDQSELCDGSKLIIRKELPSVIKKVKTVDTQWN